MDDKANNINEIDMEFSGHGDDEDTSFGTITDISAEHSEPNSTPVMTGIMIKFDDDDAEDIDITKHASNKTVDIPVNKMDITADNLNDLKDYNQIDMTCKYGDDTEDESYEHIPTKQTRSMFDDDLDSKELVFTKERERKQQKLSVDEIEDDFWSSKSKKEDTSEKTSGTLTEAVTISPNFEPYTAGYILENGDYCYLEEYHGEDDEYRDLGLPEFSNTHPEEDTCIRIYNEPNEIQYKKLEQIMDIYLNNDSYCKIELWDAEKHYYFYKVFSLYEGACEGSSIEEVVRNWKGYDLVKIIKFNIKKVNSELAKNEEPVIMEAKSSSQYSLKNQLKELQKKHAKTNKKGAYGNDNFHYAGDPVKGKELFNMGIGKNTKGDLNASSYNGDSFSGNVSDAVAAAAASASGGDAGGDGGGGSGVRESLKNVNYNNLLREVFDAIGFEVSKNKEGELIAEDLCNSSNVIKADNIGELIYQLNPFIHSCIILPLSINVGENFKSYADFNTWGTEENKTKFSKHAEEISYCDLLANHLAKCEI